MEPVDPAVETLNAYEEHATQYVDRTSNARAPLVDDLIGLTAAGDCVLELGTGPVALEAAGLVVDRTDGAAAFVERLNAAGLAARVLKLDARDFGGPYDAVFANAVLLHVPRARLTGVLEVARRATRAGGVLVASFKKGDGEGWSDQKLDARRHFTYWQEDALEAVVRDAGWTPLKIIDSTQTTSTEKWITVLARHELAR
jgi:SAM-dependent methyltransferase